MKVQLFQELEHFIYGIYEYNSYKDITHKNNLPEFISKPLLNQKFQNIKQLELSGYISKFFTIPC